MNNLRPTLLAALVCTVVAGTASAETLRWAAGGDSLTLDPHAQNEGPTHTLNHQIYEGLVQRDMEGKMIPALATEWKLTADPNVWEFKLREGVTFHDGATFDSEDVVFSLDRARKPTSDMKGLLTSIKEVKATGPHTVQIVTNGPNPILPSNLTNLFMMDKGWAEKNKVTEPQNVKGGETTFAATNANGTGAFTLVSREVDAKTVLKQNPNYWGKGQFPLQVTELVFTPIKNPATRVAALLSGEVDFIQDVPVQDIQRVAGTPTLLVSTAPQNRTIFYGMNQGAQDLQSDDVEGKNPFADVRVRTAMNMAINRQAIKQVVMRGQSQPAGVIAPPFVDGWTKALDELPPNDIAKAKGLLAEAGYPNGFATQLDCPNDRYINDEAICQATVGMLAQIGIKARLNALPKAQFFPLIQNLQTNFYMLGWGVPTFDSEYVFNFLVHTKGPKMGTWNATGYSNPELDKKIQALSSETDKAKRDAMVAEIWKTVQTDTIYLPLHHQVLNWGMKSNIVFPAQPEDQPHFKFLRITKKG